MDQRKKFTFLPKPATETSTAGSEQEVFIPDEVEDSVLEKHTDSKLQTELTPDALHKKLLSLFRETRRIEEEQGINVLYLALGFVQYFESETSDRAYYGPLVLVPVDLERSDVRSQFSLIGRDEDIEPNQALSKLLSNDFQILLPQFGADGKESPQSYCERIVQAIGSKSRWTVQLNRMVLGFFSFGKFRMLRDLEFQTTDDDGDHELLGRLLLGSTEESTGGAQVSIHAKTENLDGKYSELKDLGHILDADTSQTQVISAVKDGRNVVVQGPPGTGKSQTIANIIAVAARAGKKVLFIAEKRAALEVVFKRLELCGLGPLCLELHSHKSNRHQFYQELRRTIELSEPVAVVQSKYEEIQQIRDGLNETTALIHQLDEQTGNTPFLLMGRISELLGRGTPPPDFSVDGVESWSKSDFEDHLKSVEAYASQVELVGREQTHLWHGVHRRMNTANRVRLADLLAPLVRSLSQLNEDIKHSIAKCNLTEEASLSSCEDIIQLLVELGQQPKDIVDITNQEVIREHYQNAVTICQDISNAKLLKAQLEPKVVSGAFTQSWELALNDLETFGNSLFRIFNGAFKRARQQILSVSKDNNKKPAHLISLVKELFEFEQIVSKINSQSNIGQALFGLNWQAEATEVQEMLKTLDWIGRVANVTGSFDNMQIVVQNNPQNDNFVDVSERLKQEIAELKQKLSQLQEFADIDWLEVFTGRELQNTTLTDVATKFERWKNNLSSLDGYHVLRSLGNDLDQRKLTVIRSQIASDDFPVEKTGDIFRLLRAESVFNRLVKADPRIQELDGSDRTRKVEKFVELDSELQHLAAQELARDHYLKVPRGQTGQLALIRGEINKKTRHMPIRKLLSEAGEAVSQIKPVFLMSPLSVAQFLEPGKLNFDLLLMDEASQIKPAEALGAIMRCKQMVVVGDQKQMPPTSFFDRQMSMDEMDDDEDVSLGGQAVDMESILSLCDARAMDRAMLSWHYRSEHPSLIEVSNHEFYDAKLTYPPTPYSGHASLGLSFVSAGGVYQRGRQRNNPIEADVICEHVLEHVKNYPAQSLGVVALSVAQRDTIENKMEFLRAEHPDVDRYCAESKEEAFFVKNLENVQGDERDVIFISIGYGKDKDGYFSQNFGPVSSQGGERRLNVLFTRARKRCSVFASISHDDIRTDVSAHEGPRVLKAYLKYAATGDMDIPQLTGEDMDSPFERDVANVLVSHGYDVEAQVGSSGFKIDLAVRNPKQKQDYLLAIECDGARYHSSAWARERDRLRQQVLEGKGWKFHRIWSTDWFYNRDTEVSKLISAIEVAQHTIGAGSTNADKADTPPTSNRPIERSTKTAAPVDPVSSKVARYIESYFPESIVESAAGLDIPDANVEGLAEIVTGFVEIEGPVHQDVIVARMVQQWNVGRAGSRIREAILGATHHALKTGSIRQSELDGTGFYVLSGFVQPTVVRNRGSVNLPIVRKHEYLPLSELCVGVLAIVSESFSIARDECIHELSRRLGFGRVTAGLSNRLGQAIDRLLTQQELTESDAKLRLVSD